ncbi:CinA family protein [Microbacterium esteraromaticum]|uniref:CinA family protein n=1 Tax=Microbacterium esteraromaticum TaxID=57043 RepID=UPI0019594EC7|nr:nicotinamide-nucleotide amidohydrolase family protein [Microbacterium esteraromaticum]MBM7466388.1 nicotinamide-nucleotide amidase [Microbacterium esteraromaticum]
MSDVTALSDLARSRHLRVAVAESLTSGALASTVGAGEEASAWFGGGVVAYLPEVKERVLGFPADQDPTSAECAEQLARGARELLDADLCVSTTGVGGPDAEDGHPAGEVFLGWATRDEAGHRRLTLDGGPEEVLEATIEAAVQLLTFHAGLVDGAGNQ